MAHAWKACWVQALGGSNPPSSATGPRDLLRFRGFFVFATKSVHHWGGVLFPRITRFPLSYGTLGDNRGRKYESSTTVGGAFPGSSGVARFRALEASAVRSSPAL